MDLNVYNYLLTDFITKPTKYSTHKNSELRSVLHDIAKKTKSSPIYLVKLSDKKQSYALNVKESSMSLNAAFRELFEPNGDSVFQQKKAVSSREDQVEVEIQTDDYEDLPEPFQIQVQNLAKPQVNVSKEFYETSRSLDAGTYRFKININDNSYDFQYNIKKDARHRDVIGGLSDFITKAKIGIQASPVSNEADKIEMHLETDATGTPDGGPIMTFEDYPDGHSEGIVSYYGLNRIVQSPGNAEFTINGVPKHAMSNTFKLARSLEVTMRRTGEEAAEISYTPNSDLILSGVRNVVDSYNHMVSSSWQYVGESSRMPKLVREMRNVMYPFTSELEACGLTFDEKGYMQMDDYLSEQAAMDGSFQDLFGEGSALSARMLAKTNNVKLDPMEYVDKTLVSYPNTSKPPIGYSYTTSLYCGMLFNYYC